MASNDFLHETIKSALPFLGKATQFALIFNDYIRGSFGEPDFTELFKDVFEKICDIDDYLDCGAARSSREMKQSLSRGRGNLKEYLRSKRRYNERIGERLGNLEGLWRAEIEMREECSKKTPDKEKMEKLMAKIIRNKNTDGMLCVQIGLEFHPNAVKRFKTRPNEKEVFARILDITYLAVELMSEKMDYFKDFHTDAYNTFMFIDRYGISSEVVEKVFSELSEEMGKIEGLVPKDESHWLRRFYDAHASVFADNYKKAMEMPLDKVLRQTKGRRPGNIPHWMPLEKKKWPHPRRVKYHL